MSVWSAMLLQSESSLTVTFTLRLMWPSLQHDGQELEPDPELLELDRHAVEAVRHRDRELAARQELRFLAGEGGERRLRPRMRASPSPSPRRWRR